MFTHTNTFSLFLGVFLSLTNYHLSRQKWAVQCPGIFRRQTQTLAISYGRKTKVPSRVCRPVRAHTTLTHTHTHSHTQTHSHTHTQFSTEYNNFTHHRSNTRYAGLYELCFGFYSRKRPMVRVCVNGDPILSISAAPTGISTSSGTLQWPVNEKQSTKIYIFHLHLSKMST